MGNDDEGFSIVLDGKLDFYDTQRSVLRKLTAKETHDFKNSFRTMLTNVLPTLEFERGDVIEELTLGMINEYNKTVVRSYLKRFTPKGLKVNVPKVAEELELDEELVDDVVTNEFKHLTKSFAVQESGTFDLDDVLYADVRAGTVIDDVEKDLNTL